MAIICPACGTENRSIAKFCIECIAPLPVARAVPKPPTEPAPLPDDMPSALAAFVSPGPPSPLMPPIHVPPLPGDIRASKRAAGRQGIGVGMVLLCLVASAAIAWLLLGGAAGDGREAAARAPQAEPAADAQQREVRGELGAPAHPPQPVVVAEPMPLPTPAETLAPGESIVAAQEPRLPARSAVPAAVPAAAVARHVPAPATAVTALAAPAAPAPVPAARAEPAPPFFARCDGLGYIAASRCRVDLCDLAANRQRKECQPVLAQQRIMEEKRNPTMAN